MIGLELINVAYIVHSLQAGGIERSVTRIVNGLDPAKYRPLIVCLDRTGPAQEWLERDVPVIEIRKRSGNDLSAVRRLAGCLRDHHVDIVQSHNWGTLIETVVARKLSRTPIHIHAERGTVLGMVEGKGARHWLRARLMSAALNRVDKVVSNSRTVATRVQQRSGYPIDKIAIIPNGVPVAQIDALEQVRNQCRESLRIGPDAPVIGSVGRLVDVKGFDLAIRAFSRVLGEVPSAHLILVGEGPQHDSLMRLACELEIAGNVHFVGHQHDVTGWLATMDLYFNSSHSEGMSQSLIEAMAAGLPSVVTDVGDSRTVIGDKEPHAGITIPSGSEQAFAKAVETLLKDREQRVRCAGVARDRHQRFYSEQRLAENCEALYQTLLDGSSNKT